MICIFSRPGGNSKLQQISSTIFWIFPPNRTIITILIDYFSSFFNFCGDIFTSHFLTFYYFLYRHEDDSNGDTVYIPCRIQYDIYDKSHYILVIWREIYRMSSQNSEIFRKINYQKEKKKSKFSSRSHVECQNNQELLGFSKLPRTWVVLSTYQVSSEFLHLLNMPYNTFWSHRWNGAQNTKWAKKYCHNINNLW